MFDIDLDEFRTLERWLNTAPRKFSRASAAWVNRAAYHVHRGAQGNLRSKLVVRSDSLIRAKVGYSRASPSLPMGSQVAYVGSRGGARFTGWSEQERVGRDRRTRTFTLLSRGGSRSKKVKPMARLRRGVTRPSVGDYRAVARRARPMALLRDLQAKNYRRPFVLSGHPSLQSGLYVLRGRGRSPAPLQLFGRAPAKTTPVPWLTAAAERYLRTLNNRAVWREIVSKMVLPRQKA